MYADDTSIIIVDTDSNLEATAFHTLEQLHEWFTSNGLFLNARKTNFLIFHPKQKTIEPQYNLSINNTDLQHPESVKFLGLDIDESLSWAEACTNIASKLNRSCYLFRSLRDLLDFDTLKIVYFSEIESRLRYGILLWGTSGSAGKVLVAQKRIIRTMAKVPYNEPCKPIYKRFKVLTVVNLYILEATCYIHGVKNNFPQNAHGHDTLMARHTLRLTDTRNASILLPRHTLHLTSMSPNIMGVKLYNRLPDRLKSLSARAFKRTIRSVLEDNPLYNISDFFQLSI
ncbi:hypothetical protein QE152_g8818 [Popillia japonica]|uniref:Reverse transcriptase domain-containing protein n=1 Tax=Popillia japonica TaxID=7064 RepID=A0AAW1M0S8_POPJA